MVQMWNHIYIYIYISHKSLLTYLLTPWCRVLLEQLTGLQLVKKFPAFHGTQRVFENMVLRRIFGPRRGEVMGEWRLHNELNDLYCSPNIVRVIKSRRIRWAGHVAHMGEKRGRIGSWWGNWREGDHWGDLGIDGWIILGWISKRWDVGIWSGLGWPRIETGGGHLWVQ